MTGKPGRLQRMLKASVSSLMAPAPDPRHTFFDTFGRQQALLNGIRQAAVDLVAARARLDQQVASLRERLPDLDGQAALAVDAEREDLARLALRRRYVAMTELHELERQVGEIQMEEERLALAEQRLATRLEAFSARQQVVAARHSAADAELRIHEALLGVSDELADLGLALERAEQRTEQMEAHATAIDEMVGAGDVERPGTWSIDPLERTLGQHEMAEVIEQQLRELKQRRAACQR